VLLTLLVGAAAWPARAQTQDDGNRADIPATQVASMVGGASLALIGPIFDINEGPPSCAPCDPDDLPGIDRWVVRPEQSGWNIGSTVAELTLLGTTWYEMSREADGWRRVAASVEAVAWTIGINELSNAIIDRSRPVLYTEDAVEAMARVDSHRSLPSGHTSISFAAAMSYALSMAHKEGFSRFWPLAAATAVGAMRLAAARHFTTDVLAGAALGAGTAIVIHAIRF